MMLSDVSLSVAYIGPKSRTGRPRKTKIGTEVAHVRRDSETIFKVKGQGHRRAGAYCAGLAHSSLVPTSTSQQLGDASAISMKCRQPDEATAIR